MFAYLQYFIIFLIDLYGSSEPGDVIYDSLPRQCLLPNDVTYYNQVLNMHKIRAADYKVRGDRPSPLDLGILLLY